eukprot:NODE_990_length_1334_cov_90.204669_g817_i0.p2 GENE.NODE_990_length_1334_cov_90.204669_g817_i0~~NODE_990_length_1334_cov_90.204669_g817_i0.p2  ORF type:complete len:129 (-),score=36.77 NODE_990_length_1334_cov_90.204669_g817_i0:344-730(-)
MPAMNIKYTVTYTTHRRDPMYKEDTSGSMNPTRLLKDLSLPKFKVLLMLLVMFLFDTMCVDYHTRAFPAFTKRLGWNSLHLSYLQVAINVFSAGLLWFVSRVEEAKDVDFPVMYTTHHFCRASLLSRS